MKKDNLVSEWFDRLPRIINTVSRYSRKAFTEQPAKYSNVLIAVSQEYLSYRRVARARIAMLEKELAKHRK